MPEENLDESNCKMDMQALHERVAQAAMLEFEEQFMSKDERILYVYNHEMELRIGVSEPEAAWNLPDTFGVFRIEKQLVKDVSSSPRGIVTQADLPPTKRI